MEQLPLVSVIVPVYNMEKYLAETLDSVLTSDYPNFEVIVMNDGSKDSSLSIAQEFATRDKRVQVYSQPNAGVCAARNHAISLASGEFILPFDADDIMCSNFISDAVKAIMADNEIKVVRPKVEFMGERTGEWKLAPYSLNLLARKNMIPICSLYRKKDWEKSGGYTKDITAREDWIFWISVLKNGGKVVSLSRLSMYYQIRKTSKRITDRQQKKEIINYLNKQHPDFFERELGGPLHYQRTYSKLINKIYRVLHPRQAYVHPNYQYLHDFIKTLPIHFRNNNGKIIYKGRNELREFKTNDTELVVKAFRIPNIINRIAYGLLRSSKAKRSYAYAQMLQKSNIGTPQPIGYYTERNGFLFGKSYYISLKSECPYTYYDLTKNDFINEDKILRAIARTTAAMHEHGYLHKDYSRGNILFKESDEEVKVEIIDLNRIRFAKIDMNTGCKNFERLPATPHMHHIMSEEYAKVRGFDAKKCYERMVFYRKLQPDKIENLY